MSEGLVRGEGCVSVRCVSEGCVRGEVMYIASSAFPVSCHILLVRFPLARGAMSAKLRPGGGEMGDG